MEKIIANKKPNNQIFVKFEDIEDFVDNIKEVAWNGECHYRVSKDGLKVEAYEGWAEFDPVTQYLSNSDVSCYYPVSVEYFDENYEIGKK